MSEVEERELTLKQKRFCEEYCIDFNGKQAAIRAGYSPKTANEQASRLLTNVNVKKYISEILERKTLGPQGTKKLITDIAVGNLNDYYKTELVPEVQKIKVGLQAIINQVRGEIEFEQEYADACQFRDKELEAHQAAQLRRERLIIRHELELKRNPNATCEVDGETIMVERAVLDMEALAKDKERGRIKSIKHTQFGVQVELYGADGALTNLARIHGLFNDKVDLTTKGESLNKPMSQEEAKAFLEELKKENGV